MRYSLLDWYYIIEAERMVNNLDDNQIIELFFDRSEEAIFELSAKYGSACQQIAFNILNNKQDTEECINDAYLGVWNTIPPQRPTHLAGYVYQIIRNIATKRYHYNIAKKRNSSYDVALTELENCFPASETVEDSITASETAKAIDSFLKTLDKKSRVMFIRRYYYSDSIDELAKKFHTSKHNISVKLSRTRNKLKKYLIREGVYV